MAFECQYCNKENKNGTGKAAHERNCKDNPDHVPTLTERRAAAQAANPDNQCPECEASGSPRGFDNPGALMSHRVKSHDYVNPNKKGRSAARTELVESGAVGVSAATVRRHLQKQQQNRHDLISVVQLVFPDGIPTKDADVLDGHLSYVAQTAQILERR